MQHPVNLRCRNASQGRPPHHQQTSTATPRQVSCRSGRGRGRNSPDFGSDGLILGGRSSNPLLPNKPPPKLVLPGRNNPPTGGGGRLVIPEKNLEKLAEGAAELGPEVVTVTGPNRYRPPAGFMNDTPQDNSEYAKLSPDEMISKLRSRAGRWHQLAKMLPLLQQAGYDNSTVDEMTGITPAMQNRWLVASTVYDSLVASNKLQPGQLAQFDQKGEDLLYPFRFLNQEMRVEAAQYILDKALDAPACEVLARAMKEWERRPLERNGFTNKPGDCMAFKYLRDALECRKLDDAEIKMGQANEAAVTESARARLDEVLTTLRGDSVGSGAVAGPSGLATLTILRLDPDELGFRPIPLLGNLGQVTSDALETAPRTTQEGAFGAFSIVGQQASCKWVALPQWKALAMMRHPVALAIEDCAGVPAVVAGTKAKTEDDRKRLSGAGLVVADLLGGSSSSTTEVDTGSFYLVKANEGSSKLSLMEGAQVQARGLTPSATVAFVARPPAREQAANPNESLLQL